MEGKVKKWYEPLMELDIVSPVAGTRDALILLGVLGVSKKTAMEVCYREIFPTESIDRLTTDSMGEGG